MVWQCEVLGLKYSDVAANLGIDSAIVCRTVTQFRESGTVQKKKHPSPRAYNKLTTPLELMIVHLVLKHPGIYLHEIATELLDTTVASFSLSTICRFFKKIGFTHQRLRRLAALQRMTFSDHNLHLKFPYILGEMFIFLDETGSDKRNSVRRYGHSLRGRPVVYEKLLVRGKRVSAIAFLSVHGIWIARR